MAMSPSPSLPRSADFDANPTDFSPWQWINHLARTDTSSSTLEAIEQEIEFSHKKIDECLREALLAVPWVVRETERIRQRANVLRTSVDGVGLRVAGVESGVVSSVRTIADADTVVKRVEETLVLLKTCQSVDTLLESLDSLLASTAADGRDLVTAADVVSQLRQSLEKLDGIPELAEHRKRLLQNDEQLQSLAVPQLRNALENRNTEAARNARIVFEHAGRQDAFRTQYASLRAGQMKQAWSQAWKQPADGDLITESGQIALNSFYEKVHTLVGEELLWLRDTFPDMADLLLPQLVAQAFEGVSPKPTVRLFGDGIERSLQEVANCSVKAAARISRGMKPDLEAGEQLVTSIAAAVTALLLPYRQFWGHLGQVCVSKARTRAQGLKICCADWSGVRPPTLADLAGDVGNVSKEALVILDETLNTLTTATCGVGIEAMKQAGTMISSVLSDRLLPVLRKVMNTEGDEWNRISGALKLLVATSGLKRAWDSRRESSFAVGVGTATPILEIVSVVREDAQKRVTQFWEQVDAGNISEAGMVWELVRDERLPQRVVSAFEMVDNSNDFQSFVNAVHRAVYDCMFAGIKQRFANFNGRDLGNSDGVDGDAAVFGISSSPLGYATEVADYLMTIPQQLEPYVPDEDDAKYATPKNAYMFSKSAGMESNSNEKDEDELLSFAGIWIGALTIGMMELYVDKICALTRLSEAGTKQLATDADYICNVVASLGIAPTKEMSLVCHLLEAPPDSAKFAEVSKEHDNPNDRKLIRRIAAVRGVNITI